MTQIDIAALVGDREAGTKGPWFAESGHVQQNGQLYWQVTDGSDAIVQNQFCWCRGNHDANARRIARVPDMEDALIAQDSELRRLQAELAHLRASQADAGAVMVWECRTQIERWSADLRDKRTIGQVFDALSTLSPIAAAARVLLADGAALTELAITTMRANRLNDGKRIGYQPSLECGLRALAEQEKADG